VPETVPGTSSDFDFGFGDFTETLPPAGGGDRGGAETIADIPGDYTGNDLLTLMNKSLARGGPGMSANELLQELNRAVNYKGAAYYEIPTDPAKYGRTSKDELASIVKGFLTLLSGNISSYANDPLSPTAIKTTVQLRTVGNIDSGRAIERINEYIADNFPDNIRTTVGGTAMVEASLNRLVVDSQLISVVVSLLIVLVIITFSYKSFVAGIYGIIPLGIAILGYFAVMGFLGIKLNIGTALVASLAVGIGVDYVIHFMETYKAEFKLGGNYLERTFKTSGMAIIINAVSVGAGFLVMTFSRFKILNELGTLVTLTMFISALVSLTVIPVILEAFKPKFIRQA
jgi:predicted RND superfamily exporter protein